MREEEKYSLTWAANNAASLIPFGLTDERSDTVLPNALRDRMKELPIYIIEKNNERSNVSFNELMKEKVFWTADSQLVRSAERLVMEAKGNAKISDVVRALGERAQELPAGTILCNMDVNSILRQSVEQEFEPLEIFASETLRRAAIKWGERTPHNWARVGDVVRRLSSSRQSPRDARLLQYLGELGRYRGDRRFAPQVATVWLAAPDLPFTGMDGKCGVSSFYRTFLRGDVAVTRVLRKLADASEDEKVAKRLHVFTSILFLVAHYSQDEALSTAAAQFRRIAGDFGDEYTEGADEFLEGLRKTPTTLFDTSVWTDRNWLG